MAVLSRVIRPFYADLPAVLTVPDAAPVVKVENLRRGNSIFSVGPQP